MINVRWMWASASASDVVKLCDVVYYLGRNKIPYVYNLDCWNMSTVHFHNLDIKFKSNKQLISFKKRFG